ncbi:MAG: diadenylate cyclase CdaA [Bacteroidales bacterium]|nr:diadenylate cyclase CdaA [Bacteroidales bacterium]MDD6731812.1 diadenylate cyclase CdaA [Bacteroidales bacterium]MDY4558320.1 diadenylate cyclase CdaA [Alloprevotella sp.]
MISFGLKDALDILLVTLLLYYIYRLMKESSSANIFGGIIVFVVVWIFVSQIFEMRLLGGILDKLVNVGSLALIVLFQEEIRHFFSTIGTRPGVNFFVRLFKDKKERTGTHREDIMPIVLACMSMSKQKVGALIIIERQVGLSEYVNSGDIINANITQRLIENIFFKNSPLHDGAMIISHKRIRAAGCILPISHDTDIPKSLGLRHRAALGISQKSDCLSIVVSEETGGISIAENGNFKLRLTAEELEGVLAKANL